MAVTEPCEGGLMTMIKRYAIYYAPAEGALADSAARWLGWDAAKGRNVVQPAIDGLDLCAVTEAPRKYGFHGTLKPPFQLATGTEGGALTAALSVFANGAAPIETGPLRIKRIGTFLALVPDEPLTALSILAAKVVEAFEPFRAPPTDAETAKRRPESLTDRQRVLLGRYGYPYVMDEFRFHLTLTGPLADAAAQVEAAATEWFAPFLGTRFRIDDLCLFGEDGGGRFHLLSRHALSG